MNEMTFSQASALLNAVVKQATGQDSLSAIATPEDLVAVAQTYIAYGYDPILKAISQVWSDTIFSARPYNAEFNELEMTASAYGNAIRKLSPIAKEMTDSQEFSWPVTYNSDDHVANPTGNGESVDMYKINKQEVLQTNFYGTAVYSQKYTIFRDQLKCAFNNYSEFVNFNSLNMLQRANDREQYKENVARCIQANFIASLIDENKSERVVHLLTEYNTLTGLSLTAANVYEPGNFPPFIRWVYARIKSIARKMTSQSQYFQTVIDNKPVVRHTPPSDLRIAILGDVADQIDSMVYPVNYDNKKFEFGDYRKVSYWQSIKSPANINVAPVYTDTDGNVKKGSPVTGKTIWGLIHDKAALGYAEVEPWTGTTPLNISGGYWNEEYHARYKTIQDNTEKAVVLLLD